ncbi:pentapeptide repeat-containing protein [Dapis sp. BLCC M126]
MRKKRKQTSKNKKLEERIENLREQGFYFPPNIQSPNKKTSEKQTRLIRRIADWWETTFIEKFLEDIHYLLKNSATLEIIGLLANVTIIVSLVTWLTGLEEQKENKLFSTWTIINDAEDDQSGVVKIAVERLYKDGFPLSGLKLNKTNLSKANLNVAKLSGAYLSRANLSMANLIKADLSFADLIGANLSRAKLRGANLNGANLIEANLIEANLSGANLIEANFSLAKVRGANLSGANLSMADLSGADLSGVDLRGANLSGVDLIEANLSVANLSGANLIEANLSNAQIKLACNWKEAIYVNSTKVEGKLIKDKQANQDRIEEIEQDKDSDPKNPPDCSIWKKD